MSGNKMSFVAQKAEKRKIDIAMPSSKISKGKGQVSKRDKINELLVASAEENVAVNYVEDGNMIELEVQGQSTEFTSGTENETTEDEESEDEEDENLNMNSSARLVGPFLHTEAGPVRTSPFDEPSDVVVKDITRQKENTA